jgi:hypothetical protein
MIPRTAAATLQRLAQGFPIVALTGLRQSGKTTLAKAVFADKASVSFENPDEVQCCPHLLSWPQSLVYERARMGDFVLTGSARSICWLASRRRWRAVSCASNCCRFQRLNSLQSANCQARWKTFFCAALTLP